jgi:hypothetical protein
MERTGNSWVNESATISLDRGTGSVPHAHGTLDAAFPAHLFPWTAFHGRNSLHRMSWHAEYKPTCGEYA